jgi:hypothetical protein
MNVERRANYSIRNDQHTPKPVIDSTPPPSTRTPHQQNPRKHHIPNCCSKRTACRSSASAMGNRFVQYLRGEQNLPGERKLVQKLDFFILTFCCLMYFLNYLDRTNLNNAYVSGMREELSFRGNQLNQINTVFTVGYTIGQVPSNIALYYIKPRIFFPSCMVCVSQDYSFCG